MKKLRLIIFLSLMIVQNVWADAPTVTAPTSAPDTGAMGQFKKYFDTSMGVFVVAGIATVFSATLYKAAGKQEEESKENIKKLDKIIASFNDSFANLCPNGREKQTEPKCYCYLESGQKNSNRTNSATCTALWAKDSYKLNGNATNYNAGVYTADVAGCVNSVTGEFDENCKCKKMVDTKGNNACKKTVSISIPADNVSTGIATESGLNKVLDYVANATNGNPRYDLLSTGSLNTNAIKTKQMIDQLSSKLPAGVTLPKINESNVNKFASAIMGRKNIDNFLASSRGKASAMNVGSERANNPAVENLLRQVQNKAGLDLSGSGKGLDGKVEAKKPGMNFNFSDGGSGVAGGNVVQDFPEENKNYKYKNSDIVTDNTSSLFEIISNRYVQSGLRRLFDDEQPAK